MKKKYLWENSIDEIVQGYKENNNYYTCIFCNEKFNKGKIVEMDHQLFDAYGAVKYHMNQEHGSVTDFMLHMSHTLFGVSEIQLNVLTMIACSKTDKEIAEALGVTQSTVRTHRFKLREKEKQAKLYLSLMESIRNSTSSAIHDTDIGSIEEIHATAKMIDDRYNITDSDRLKVIKTYMEENKALKQFPPKAKKKIILLREIIKNFKPNVEYSENEVNRILERIYDDYPTIRRSLIEYGFMDRSKDCTVYRVKE